MLALLPATATATTFKQPLWPKEELAMSVSPHCVLPLFVLSPHPVLLPFVLSLLVVLLQLELSAALGGSVLTSSHTPLSLWEQSFHAKQPTR